MTDAAITLVGVSAVLTDRHPDRVPAAVTAATAAGALDLRVSAPDSARWEPLGFAEVAPGELARPLPQLVRGVAATEALGRRLAGLLRAGDVVVLSGPLGAGKTALTRGIAAGLGVTGAVTSPTFVLARTHPGAVPLVHVDAYRLRAEPGRPVDLDDLDLDLALQDGVVVVEWGEGLVEALSEHRIVVQLSRSSSGCDGQDRVATVAFRGARWATG